MVDYRKSGLDSVYVFSADKAELNRRRKKGPNKKLEKMPYVVHRLLEQTKEEKTR